MTDITDDADDNTEGGDGTRTSKPQGIFNFVKMEDVPLEVLVIDEEPKRVKGNFNFSYEIRGKKIIGKIHDYSKKEQIPLFGRFFMEKQLDVETDAGYELRRGRIPQDLFIELKDKLTDKCEKCGKPAFYEALMDKLDKEVGDSRYFCKEHRPHGQIDGVGYDLFEKKYPFRFAGERFVCSTIEHPGGLMDEG